MLGERTHFGRDLRRRRPGIVALTGGGGKTSLLYALGIYLGECGCAALCTTTTRLAYPSDRTLPFAFHPEPSSIRLRDGESLLAIRPPEVDDKSGKVDGYSAAEVDSLVSSGAASWIIVEADGAAGRPLKAPATHEPVIPFQTRVAVAVLGLGGIGKCFGPDTVFRHRLAAAICGLSSGDPITPEAAANMVTHPRGLFQHVPAHAERILFCNQADLPGAYAAGETLASRIITENPGFLRDIYIGSLAKDGLECLRIPGK